MTDDDFLDDDLADFVLDAEDDFDADDDVLTADDLLELAGVLDDAGRHYHLAR